MEKNMLVDRIIDHLTIISLAAQNALEEGAITRKDLKEIVSEVEKVKKLIDIIETVDGVRKTGARSAGQ